jgi:hypothetical protein
VKKTFGLIESSGRFDRPDSWFRHALWNLLDMRGVSVVAGTEAKTREDRLFKRKGWDHQHGSDFGVDDRGSRKEAWLMWDTNIWEKVGRASTPKLSGMTYTRSNEYGGGETPFFRALRVILKHKKTGELVIFYVVHLPLDNTPLRAEVWLDTTKGLHELHKRDDARHPAAHQVLVGDINKNYREDGDRAACIRHLSVPNDWMNSWRDNLPRNGGTHGPRGIIDHAYSCMKALKCKLLKDDKSSDHRPFKVKYQIDESVKGTKKNG